MEMERSVERRIRVEDPAAAGQDVARAIQTLSDADRLRLEALARLRAQSLPNGFAWTDLLHEAIRRALEGVRPWPPNVPIVAFLAGIMRSIWSEHWRRGRREADWLRIGDAGGGWDADTQEPNPERVVAAAQALACVYRLFAHDGAVLQIIAGLSDGLTAEEIRGRCGMSELEYDTARKRMRRALLRLGLAWRQP